MDYVCSRCQSPLRQLDIVVYIAADNVSAAERFVPAVEETCTQQFPLNLQAQ
jgi:hypothetical protein